MPKARQTKFGPEVVDLLAEPAAQPAIEVGTAEVIAERPVPEAELSPQGQRIRELEHQLALERGKKDPEIAEPDPGAVEGLGDDTNIVIHILEDGFTHAGKVWYRGQELEFVPGSQQWRETCDRTGRSWLDLRGDEFAQVERWGKVMFRNGPWPGRSYLDAAKELFDGVAGTPDEEQLRAAQQAEARRRRAVPSLSR